jgi:glucan-binding YG repeat protein
MWIKDSEGNWFLADKKIIANENPSESTSAWVKDANGNWYMTGEASNSLSCSCTDAPLKKLAS